MLRQYPQKCPNTRPIPAARASLVDSLTPFLCFRQVALKNQRQVELDFVLRLGEVRIDDGVELTSTESAKQSLWLKQ